MQELRFVAVSEDGSYAVLAVPGRSGRYILPIDERLRAVALGQTSRLAQYEIEVESPLRPKEIQARIRAGETAEEIADAAGIPVERVRWFEGPVLAERAYIADQAQSGSVRRSGDSAGPGPRLRDIVTERLSAAGTDPAEGQWDSRKRGDGNWQVSLTFPSGGRLHVAEWVFDPRRRHVMPDDDNAARLSLPESDLPAEPVPMPGEATVTSIAPRLGAAAGMGGGGVGAPGVSRFRPDRSVIPDRSLGVDRSLAERPAVPDRAAAGPPDRAATSSSAVPPRPGQQDRPSPAGRPAHPGYAEFPESAPYRAPEPGPGPGDGPAPAAEPPARHEPRGYDDPASAPGALQAPATEPPAQRDYADPASAPAAYREPDLEPPAYREPLGFRAPAAEPPVHGERRTSPAADHAPAREAPATSQPERVPVSPPRPVVFEDPGPTFPDDETGTAPELPPGPPAAESLATAPSPAMSAPAAPAAPAAGPADAPSPSPDMPAESPEPAAEAPTIPAAGSPGASADRVTPAAGPPADVPSPAESAPVPGEAQSARRTGKKNAKARRSSVPSWDEIMLGSSRQRD